MSKFSEIETVNMNRKLSKNTIETRMEWRKKYSRSSCGMSQSDISEQIKNLYNVDISDGLVSKIVEKITPEISAWQNRPPDAIYPFIFGRNSSKSKKIISISQKQHMLFWEYKWTDAKIYWVFG